MASVDYIEADSLMVQYFLALQSLDENSAMRWIKKSIKFGSFMIYARGLFIAHSEDPRYWNWSKLTAKDPVAEVAELIEISSLKVSGSLKMSYLTTGQKYAVMFVIKMTDKAYSKTVAIVELKLPDGTEKLRMVSLTSLKKHQWLNVKVGTFVANCKDGYVEFTLRDTDPRIKAGLKVAGALIQPRV